MQKARADDLPGPFLHVRASSRAASPVQEDDVPGKNTLPDIISPEFCCFLKDDDKQIFL